MLAGDHVVISIGGRGRVPAGVQATMLRTGNNWMVQRATLN